MISKTARKGYISLYLYKYDKRFNENDINEVKNFVERTVKILEKTEKNKLDLKNVLNFYVTHQLMEMNVSNKDMKPVISEFKSYDKILKRILKGKRITDSEFDLLKKFLDGLSSVGSSLAGKSSEALKRSIISGGVRRL
jgi:hypothetical protein